MKHPNKNYLPESVMNTLRNTRDWFTRLPEEIKTKSSPVFRESVRKIQRFHNGYKGERCFIIGNGPSLRKMDLSRLKKGFTFGMNRIFLMYPQLGFSTTFLVSINNLVIEQSATDIQSLKIPRFVSWRSRTWLHPEEDLFFLYTTYTGPKFARDVTGRVWEGATVTYVSLQLAYYFGFSEVVLIGVDHNFATKGEPNKTVTSEGNDPNHFHPDYFGKGFRWQLPDLETSEIAYRLAKNAFESDGRRVIDATKNGKLTVFPKVDYETLF